MFMVRAAADAAGCNYDTIGRASLTPTSLRLDLEAVRATVISVHIVVPGRHDPDHNAVRLPAHRPTAHPPQAAGFNVPRAALGHLDAVQACRLCQDWYKWPE